MRIGYDSKRLFFNQTGLGNYARTLVHNIKHHYPGSDISLYSPANPKDSEFVNLFSEDVYHYEFPGPTSPLWRSIGISNAIKARALDIYHGLSNELPLFTAPLKGTKTVLTVHDLLFMDFPEDYSFVDRSIYGRKTKSSCKTADCIVAISEWTKSQLIEKLKVPEEKIQLAYQSIRSPFHDLDVQDLQPDFPFKTKEFMLYVGTMSYRKNLLGILQAMENISDENCPPLVVVGGGRGKYYNSCMQLMEKLGSRVVHLSEMEIEDLIALYDHALLTIYPSRAEGFGLPVVESLQRGTAVITCKNSALKEAGGKHVRYVFAEQIDSIEEAILELSGSPSQGQELLDQVENHLIQFDPAQTSGQMVRIYERILAE